MSLEQQIQKAVTDAVHAAMGEALKDLKPLESNKDVIFLNTEDAGLIYGCSDEYIRQLQNKGHLTLYTLPGSKHRRVLKSELLALIEKNAQRLPIVKKKQ